MTANAITDASGSVLQSGTICFQPVNYQLLPTAFTAGGGGAVHSEPVCRTVTNGVMAGLTLAASNYTSPVGIQYKVTVTDDVANVPMFLGNAYITGTTFDLDQWSASQIVTLGVAGNAFITGALTASGAITATVFNGNATSATSWATLPNSCPAGMTPTSQDIHGNWLNCVTSSYQTGGSASGAIAQNPSGNQMITLTSGNFQRIGSSGSYAQFDVNGNAVIPSVAGLQFVNGTVEADQFTGADMCAKINAAASYAIANGYPVVDATHFKGVQACTSGVQPFSGFTGLADYNPANLAIELATFT